MSDMVNAPCSHRPTPGGQTGGLSNPLWGKPCVQVLSNATGNNSANRRLHSAPMRLQANDIYGGVVGTVLASVIVAAMPLGQSPLHSALWVSVSVAIAAITRSYGQHVSTHNVDSDSGFWLDLGRSLLTGVPLVIACVPTVFLLALAHFRHLHDDIVHPNGSVTSGFTTWTMVLNMVLLFGWGVLAARSGGYAGWRAAAIGIGNTVLGLAVFMVNILVR